MQYKIGGCDVFFPHTAYGVQLSFMNKVINSLESGNNALLEAPTGSGKTLSLLCSALAWQQREKLRIEEGLAAVSLEPNSPIRQNNEDNNPFQSPIKAGVHEEAVQSKGTVSSTEIVGDGGFLTDQQESDVPLVRKNPPKIFYATRTHSQIAQVVRELKRSNYHPKMAVLASRKQYCINKYALSKPSVDEACEELRADSNCRYHKNFMTLVTAGFGQKVHDIEDLCNYGRSNKACPYFASRKMAEEAELIFGPYSYLLDPVIRRAMSINVVDSILIFDEAHNIEDVCRESASCEVDRTTMIEVAACFNKALVCNSKPEVYQPLADVCGRVLFWMNAKENEAVADLARQRRPRPPTRQDPYEVVYQAQPLLDQLAAAGLGPEKVDTLWECYQLARAEDEEMAAGKGAPHPVLATQQREGDENKDGVNKGANQDGAPPLAVRVGALALGVMSRLVHTVKMLHQVSSDGSRDYRLVVQRYEDLITGPRFQGRTVKAEGDVDGDAGAHSVVVNLCLWCLNPAVAFKEVSDTAHSIILTSGTLAPLDSFASELGSPFRVKLEAPHVVDMRRQVWAGIVTHGPGHVSLEGSYQNTQHNGYLDAVGRTVLECCTTIPDGVLLFVSSYAMLDKLMKRWKAIRLWGRLERLKHIVMEPRGGGSEGLQKVMETYYHAIATGRGGLFMAVCRGKVSEGLDFADANARGVIIVGIPFPSVKDTKVNEKKAFNNRNRAGLGLLSGDAWYQQQAFRALNQAVGRCIRHRYDWGAIVLVDDRFRQPRNQGGLSRWVRGALVVHPSFDAATISMKQFFSTIQADPPQRPSPKPDGETGAAEAELAAAFTAAAAVAAATGSLKEEPAGGEPGVHCPGAGEHQGAHLNQQEAKKGVSSLMGGTAITQAVGRGAEGAVGGWMTRPPETIAGSSGGRHSPSRHPGGVAAQLESGVWPGARPLAQARQGVGAAGAAWGHAQPDPLGHHHPSQTSLQQPPLALQLQAGKPLAHECPVARGNTGSPGGGPPSAADAVHCAPLREWARRDVQAYVAFLVQRGVRVEMMGGGQSMEQLASAAVEDSFEAAREFLASGRPLHQLAAEWQSSLPRGLQAMVAAGGGGLPTHVQADPQAVEFGLRHLKPYHKQTLLEAMARAYSQALRCEGGVGPHRGGVDSAQPSPGPAHPACASLSGAAHCGLHAAHAEGSGLGDFPTQPYQEAAQGAGSEPNSRPAPNQQLPGGFSQFECAPTQPGPHLLAQQHNQHGSTQPLHNQPRSQQQQQQEQANMIAGIATCSQQGKEYTGDRRRPSERGVVCKRGAGDCSGSSPPGAGAAKRQSVDPGGATPIVVIPLASSAEEGWEETPGGVVSLQQQGGGLPQPSQHSAQQGQELGRAETAPRTSSAEKRAQAKRAAIAACLADSEDEDCL